MHILQVHVAVVPYAGGGGGQTLQLSRSPSRLGVGLAGGDVASRPSGWFAHLLSSTSDLPLTGTVSGALTSGKTLWEKPRRLDIEPKIAVNSAHTDGPFI
ncbi:hypothetical protein B0H14DRAFT_3472536 [Mycena olivaceomarginata]|nr:hypothetical protein B0H14DRAFT_3472536 [Mycena olivaceomarginata]